MPRTTLGIELVCAATFVVCAAASADAQQGGAAPYGNLFGTAREPLSQSLDVRGSLFGGYDDDVLAQATNGNQGGLFNSGLQVPGITSGFSSTANYGYVHAGRGRRSSQFRFGGSASVQEFTGVDSRPLWLHNYGANASFGTNLTPKVSFSATGIASYGPYYQYAPFLNSRTLTSALPDNSVPTDSSAAGTGTAPDVPAPLIDPTPPTVSPVGTDVGYALGSIFVRSLAADVSVTDRITKRTSISVNARLEQTQVLGQARIENRSATARIAHHLTRRLGLHVGYGLQDVHSVQGSLPNSQTQNQLIDAGFDFGDGFSFARYYTLSFSTSTSALRQGAQTEFRVNGDATLMRSIGRTWAASLNAARGTAYVVGFTAPFFYDTANAGFGGQLAPRLHFSVGANYLRGQSAFSTSSGTLVSKSASTRLTLGLNQHAGLYTQFSLYQYDVPPGFFTTIDFAPHQNRRSASVGLTLWAPLIHRRSTR